MAIPALQTTSKNLQTALDEAVEQLFGLSVADATPEETSAAVAYLRQRYPECFDLSRRMDQALWLLADVVTKKCSARKRQRADDVRLTDLGIPFIRL